MCDICQKILSGHENFCDVLRQKNGDRKNKKNKTNKILKKYREVKL